MMSRQCSVTVLISKALLEDPRYDVPALIKAKLEERLEQFAQREHELQVRGSSWKRELVGIHIATEAT